MRRGIARARRPSSALTRTMTRPSFARLQVPVPCPLTGNDRTTSDITVHHFRAYAQAATEPDGGQVAGGDTPVDEIHTHSPLAGDGCDGDQRPGRLRKCARAAVHGIAPRALAWWLASDAPVRRRPRPSADLAVDIGRRQDGTCYGTHLTGERGLVFPRRLPRDRLDDRLDRLAQCSPELCRRGCI